MASPFFKGLCPGAKPGQWIKAGLLCYGIWLIGVAALSAVFKPVGQSSLPYMEAMDPVQLVLMAPLVEEVVFRSVLWRLVSGELFNRPPCHSPLWSAGITAAVFALAHVTYWQHPYTVAYVLIGSGVLTLARWQGESWLASWITHALINATVVWAENGI